MYKNIYKILTLIGIFLLGACQTHQLEDSKGYLYVSVSKDISPDIVFSKSGADQEQVFSLAIYKGDELVASCDDHRKLADEPIELVRGNYTAKVSSVDGFDAAFDAPFYVGEQDFLLKQDVLNVIDVSCSLANILVTTEFTDSIKENFQEYVVTVSNGLGTLTYSSVDGSVNKEGYFSVTDQLTWSLILKNNRGQVYAELNDTYTDLKANQHYKLIFDLSADTDFGGAAVTVSLDDSTTSKEYNLLLDFEAGIRPAVTSDNFDLCRVPVFPEGGPASATFKVSAPGGFKTFTIGHNNAKLTAAGLASSNNFMAASSSVISSYASLGITMSYVAAGDKETVVDMGAFLDRLPVGKYQLIFNITANDGRSRVQYVDFEISLLADVEAVSATPWAKFATLTAKWYPDEIPASISFQYKKSQADEWITVESSEVVVNNLEKTYSAEIYNLDPATQYTFKAISEGVTDTKQKTFTTESTPTLHNMNFDSWYKSGSSWYPNASGNYIWDTANEGANTVSAVNPTTPESNVVAVSGSGKQAARLESKVVFDNFAAGNIFTGDFGKASLSPLGATLTWGVPFTGRPVALRGYYNYIPVNITHTKAPYKHLAGTLDQMQIQILLTDWDAPFAINTATSTFVLYDNDPGIIARGHLEHGANTNGYVNFTMELVYRNTTRIPKYIVIVAAASRYGDYFTGGKGSVLYVDEFELVYDPLELK